LTFHGILGDSRRTSGHRLVAWAFKKLRSGMVHHIFLEPNNVR
jgi:hypothetical protein